MSNEIKPEHVVESIEQLFEELKSVQMATVNANGEPESSYTPYLLYQNRIYIFISELAAHTQNLQQNSLASLFFIEDESLSKNIFARKRLSLKAKANFIERHHKGWTTVLDLFEERQGSTVSLLKGLTDFHLVAFEIDSGLYVQGFGQAFGFDGMRFDTVTLLTGK